MSFETLRQCLIYNAQQEEKGKVENYDPTECPYDCWPLNINSQGQKSCPICERIWK